MKTEDLTGALQRLAEENAAVPVPPDLEARVLAAFDARVRPAVRTRWWLPASACAMAALFALAAFLLLHSPAAPAAHPAGAYFVPIPYVAPPAPYERTEVIRMNVPVAALLAAGLEVRKVDAGETVQADVLVGQDGRPLAIRFLKNAI